MNAGHDYRSQLGSFLSNLRLIDIPIYQSAVINTNHLTFMLMMSIINHSTAIIYVLHIP